LRIVTCGMSRCHYRCWRVPCQGTRHDPCTAVGRIGYSRSSRMSEGREPGMRWVIRLAGLILGAVLGVQVAGVLQPSPVPIGPLRVPVFAAGIVVGGLLGALLSVWVWHRFERAMAWVLARLAL